MNLAWKEMRRNKIKFLILGSIIFLISFLTFIISGLANGLSEDNAALIKDLPEGQYYMAEDADESYNLSRIESSIQEKVLSNQSKAVALSIQMGFVHDKSDKPLSVAFVTSTASPHFLDVQPGEIILDRSIKSKGIKEGDKLTVPSTSREFTVKGFVDQKKFSHAPVAFINMEDYKLMHRVEEMQLIFIPGMEKAEVIAGLETFTKKQFLQTIPSYNAEQMTLTMIVWFLVVISGMLFAIFFYMMNVQKIGLYGILKALGLKTSALFKMMWTQMLSITAMALCLAAAMSQGFQLVAPEGMPFHLSLPATMQLSIVFLFIGFIGASISGIQIKKSHALQAIQQGEV